MPDSRKLRVFLCHSSNDKPAVRELYHLSILLGQIMVLLEFYEGRMAK